MYALTYEIVTQKEFERDRHFEVETNLFFLLNVQQINK
jgi:hypothetical protein